MFSLPLILILTFLQRLFLFLCYVVFMTPKTQDFSATGESSPNLCFQHEWCSFVWSVLLREVLHLLLSLLCSRWLLCHSQFLRECINNTCTDNKIHLALGIVLCSCCWCSLIQVRIFEFENCFSNFS